MREERNDIKKKNVKQKKEPDLENLKSHQPIHMAESEKACSGEIIKGIAEKPLNKEIVGMIQRHSHPSQ